MKRKLIATALFAGALLIVVAALAGPIIDDPEPVGKCIRRHTDQGVPLPDAIKRCTPKDFEQE